MANDQLNDYPLDGDFASMDVEQDPSKFLETELFEKAESADARPPSGAVEKSSAPRLLAAEQVGFPPPPATCNLKNSKDLLNIAVFIRDSWKQQVDSLGLEPVHEMLFYRQRFTNLFDILSIALFGSDCSSQTQNINAPANDTNTVSQDDTTTTTQGTKEVVKKKRAAPSNDFEFIVFKKNDKYVYRRLESATKYATKSKLDRYISVVPKDDECGDQTKTLMKKIREYDSKFVSGNVLSFDGSYAELYDRLRELLCAVSMDQIVTVNLKDGGDRAEEEDVAVALGLVVSDDENEEEVTPPPPVKKAKKRESKKATGETKKSKTSSHAAGDVHRTYVEEDTENENVVNAVSKGNKKREDDEYATGSAVFDDDREMGGYDGDFGYFGPPPDSPPGKSTIEHKVKTKKTSKKTTRDDKM